MQDTRQQRHGVQPRDAQQHEPEPANWLWIIFLALFLAVFAAGPLAVYFGTKGAGLAALIEGLIASAAGVVMAAIGVRKSLAARRAFEAATAR
jgi:hypothetical protein